MTVRRSGGASVLERPAPVLHDFQRPTTLTREQQLALESAFESFARQWGAELTALLRVTSRATFSGLSMQTWEGIASTATDGQVLSVWTVEGVTPRAIVQFELATTLGWVARMLGATGDVRVPDRHFTRIEESIVTALLNLTHADLSFALSGVAPLSLAFQGLYYTAAAAQPARPSDLYVVSTLRVRVGDGDAAVTIALPADALLLQGDASAPSIPSFGDFSRLLRDQVASVPLAVALQLTPTQVEASDILDLAVGDVINIPHPQHRPLDVAVRGEILARAAVGANGKRLAFVVTSIEEQS